MIADSRLYDAAAPKTRVTGASSSPGSGISAWKPSWAPTGAAIERVNHGLDRCAACLATHQKPHT